SGTSSKKAYGLLLGRSTTNRNAPREGCVSAASTCQLTTYVPVLLETIGAVRTDPRARTAPATWLPDGSKTLMPAPAGVTGSVKTSVIDVGAESTTESGAGSDCTSCAWADATWGINARAIAIATTASRRASLRSRPEPPHQRQVRRPGRTAAQWQPSPGRRKR